MRKLKAWFIKFSHGYDIPPIVKPKPLLIKPTDRLCVLAPHADDETIGTGGLLSLYGPQTDVILLTDGTKGGQKNLSKEITKAIRDAEFENVMKYFKVKNFSSLGAKDGYLIESYAKFNQLDFSAYDYVFMPHKHDGHKDHIVIQAFFKRLKKKKKFKAKAVYYEVWGTMTAPTHYLDITTVQQNKMSAMKFYASQTNINYIERILALNHYRGMRHNIDYAEAYTLD